MKKFLLAALVPLAVVLAPVAHAEPPAVPLCQLGGETPCFCPDDGSMRTDPWAMCTATTYGPWRGAAVEQRGEQ